MQFELSTSKEKKYPNLGEAFVAAKGVNMREGKEIQIINQHGNVIITFPGTKK
jgi:hypothetical protein